MPVPASINTQNVPASLAAPTYRASFQHYIRSVIRPGLPVTSVMAIVTDYLSVNRLIDNFRYSFGKNQIICRFSPHTVDQKSADQPPQQELTIELLGDLVKTALNKGGYAVKNILPTLADSPAELTFQLSYA